MKHTNKFVPFVSGMLALLSFHQTVLALDIPITDDATVIQAQTTTNFGNGTAISVIGTSGAARHTYLRFLAPPTAVQSIGYYLPVGTKEEDISQALLHLYVSSVTTAGSINISSVAASPTWTESGITYTNKPAATGTPIVVPITAADLNEFVTVDVTALVKSWLTTPSTNTGLVLTPVGTTVVVGFNAKESGMNRPVLDVTLVKQRILPRGDVSMGTYLNGTQP